MEIVLHILCFIVGGTVVLSTVLSAIRTFVLPRSARDSITRYTFLFLRRLFNFFVHRAIEYSKRDQIMAYYAPISLLILQMVWLFLLLLGFMSMFWALGTDDWMKAFTLSGSCLFTLGFATASDLPEVILAFFEAATGLIMVALLIAYLPTLYSAFSKREASVAMMEVRAGSPPSAVEMLMRYHRLRNLDLLHEIWVSWELWFVELSESHTSLAVLSFFRSPQPKQSWVTTAGAVLDAAALLNAVVDTPHDPQADLCLRAGFLALRRIADYFRVPHNPDPHWPRDQISIARSEFNDACGQLSEAGVPLKEDRDLAWQNFAGWRVNYDYVLLALAALTMAPEALWSSDRGLRMRWKPTHKR